MSRELCPHCFNARELDHAHEGGSVERVSCSACRPRGAPAVDVENAMRAAIAAALVYRKAPCVECGEPVEACTVLCNACSFFETGDQGLRDLEEV